jgi:hypothetical protein
LGGAEIYLDSTGPAFRDVVASKKRECHPGTSLAPEGAEEFGA